MNYQQIKTELKALKAQGYSIPALNSKKEVLETALAQILLSITPEIIQPEVIESTPAATITTTEPAPITTPDHPAVTEFKSIAKGIETALIWAIALVRSLIRFSTPRVKKALGIALRVTIYTAVILQPKAQLIAYTVGIWGMTIALRLIRNRGWAIA